MPPQGRLSGTEQVGSGDVANEGQREAPASFSPSPDEVWALQRQLSDLGHAVAKSEMEDGVVGPTATRALLDFQRGHGLPVTGVADERTLRALSAAAQPFEPPRALADARVAGVPELDLDAGKLVANETNKGLVVSSDGAVLVFAPLERRMLKKEDVDLFRSELEQLRQRNYVSISEPEPETSTAFTIVVGLGFWIVLAFAIYGAVNRDPVYWIVGGAAIILALVLAAVVAKVSAHGAFMPWVAQVCALVLVIGVGVAVPGSSIYFTAGVDDLVHQAYFGKDLSPSDIDLTLLGRGLQLLFIAIASLLPALLYFLFDRQQLRTLRDQFERHMFRLDPTIETLTDIRAKYGTIMDEVYGTGRADGSGRLLPGRRSPILVATVVITAGWLLTLLNTDVGRILDSTSILGLFHPEQSAVVFAFLGAYFFALNLIQRGYARADLRPKSYTQITVRILTVVILAWVLELLFQNDASYLLVLAFVAGIVPDTVLVRLQEYVRRGSRTLRSMAWISERDPLTNLEGIDIYDRARLLDEGVSNVEGLAHHDLIELMLQTRIPAPQLVDWTDQAILYLHVGNSDARAAAGSRQKALNMLRMYGIRTATDLEQSHWEAKARGELEQFLKILPGGSGPCPRLSVILDTLRDEEWMTSLRYWHETSRLDEQTLPWPPASGNGSRAPAADLSR